LCFCSLISEWLHTLKLEQYLEPFESHGLYTVADLRALGDEELTKIGVLLPGHRRRILGFLQKSMSLEYPAEEAACRPVPMKRNVFRGGSTSSDQEAPPSMPNNCPSVLIAPPYTSAGLKISRLSWNVNNVVEILDIFTL
uniref:SAM domain-containing protein n=1 Tax=Xenopus tropicalis TaxID=8364 RepID=A0A803JRY8_XENTR